MKDIRARKFFVRVAKINNTKEDGIYEYNFEELYDILCSKYDKVMYIVHDKDPKNIHAHYIIQNKTQIRKSTLINIMKYSNIEKQKGSNLECYEYLQHKDIEDKDPYDEKDIIYNFNDELDDWLKETNEKNKSKYQMMIDDLYNGLTPQEIMKKYPQEYFTHRNKILAIHQDLMLIKSENFRNLLVIYIWGDSRTGKTRSVIEYCKNNNLSFCRVTDYDKDSFQNYMGEKVLILDEYRSNYTISNFLTYLDGYEKTSLPSRYSNKSALYDIVFIISNIPLYQQYPNVDEKTKIAIKNRITYDVQFTKAEITLLQKGRVIKRIPNPYYSND